MESIVDISEKVFQFLLAYKREQEVEGKKFYFTLRRSNQKKRLEYRYWFHGNDTYLAVSFWLGIDYQNKTPNIFIRITDQGKIFLSITAKDSIKKTEAFEKLFVSSLNLEPDGADRWKRELFSTGYLEALSDFLTKVKPYIDSVVNDSASDLQGDDPSNSVGFITEVQFNKWLDEVNKYRSSEAAKILPVSLTSIRVQHYTPIDDVSFSRISNGASFIFLVGENGSGKSSLLKAIAIALGNSYYSEGMEPDNAAWIIDFSYQINGTRRKVSINKFHPRSRRAKGIPFACYGPMRMMTNKVIVTGTRNTAKTGPLDSLFYLDGILLDFNRWMLGGLSDKNHGSRNKNRYENIKQILISTIPNLYDIRTLEFDGGEIVPQVLYFENDFDGNKIPIGVLFDHLSSGIKSLVGMLGDMLVRLFDSQPEIEDPAELVGIVLIDEIDIHLHPNWQKKVPELLVQNFPKIQFIATTHSPIPLLGAPPNSELYNVSRKSKEGVVIKALNYINISNLLPNTILTSPIFGMDEIVSVNNKSPESVKVDDNYDDLAFFDLVDKKLKQLITSQNMRDKKYFKYQMRAVQKNWNNPPSALNLNNLTAVIDTTNPLHRDEINRNIYANHLVVRQLIRIYHSKCAYCESFEPEPDVEHYRPKRSIQEAPGHLGYYWLCYEWSNLLPACHDCNKRRSKGTHFPIEGVRLTAPILNAGVIDLAENLLNSATLSITEIPMLLHPEFPGFNPFTFFKIDAYGKFCPLGTTLDLLNRRAAATIDTMRLNRDKLWLIERKHSIKGYMDRVRIILLKYMQGSLNEQQYADAFREILQEIANKTRLSIHQEYWFFWNYFYNNFIDFLSAYFKRRLRRVVVRTFQEVRVLIH